MPEELQSEQAFQALLQALRVGNIRSSEFMAMPMLAETLGFPLAPTREAVKRAEAQSLLSVLPKRGVIIMEAGPETTRECMEMRALLEKEGVKRLLNSNAAELRALRNAHEDLLDDASHAPRGDLSKRALATDLSLHDFMASGLDNTFLRQAYAANRNRISVIQNARSFLADRVVPAMQEHLEIITALEQGDGATAIERIEHHLHLTLRWWGVNNAA